MEKLAFSAAEAAEVIGVSEWTIYRLVERGDLSKLPHLGKRVLIARLELERFAREGVKAEAS
jgi:excisionase family DNA binding protein